MSHDNKSHNPMSPDASDDEKKAAQQAKKDDLARKQEKSADPDNTYPQSGLRPDLAKPGKDGKGGDAGGVGSSI